MVKTYVQYISVGIGIFNNTKEVVDRDIEEVVENIVKIESEIKNLKIIGFRFFDKDEESEEITNISGISYIHGEVFTYPKLSNEMLQFIHNTGIKYKNGQKLIVVLIQSPMVYEFNSEDNIIDFKNIIMKIDEEKQKLRLEKIQDVYKNRLYEDLENLKELIRSNRYKEISLAVVENDNQEEFLALDILNDGGNFKNHLDYLKGLHKEIINLNKGLSSVDSLE